MLIRDQFKRAFLAIAAAIAVACTLFLLMYLQWTRMRAARTWAHEVVWLTFQCHVLATEVVTAENPRAKEQYCVTSGQLGALLALPPNPLRAHRLVKEIAEQKALTDRLLRSDTEVAPGSVVAERRSMVHGQIILQSTVMVSAAQALYKAADIAAKRLRFLTMILVLTSLLAIGVTTGLSFYRVNRSLVGPLQEMVLGAQKLGAGELGYRLDLNRSDELGTLACGFNSMAEKLAGRQAELEEKLKDLDTFCYSLAHDLKAPLRAVSSFGELLAEEHGADLSAEGKTYIQRMRQATVKMALLIDDLLEYGTLTHKEFAVHPASLGAIVTQVRQDLEHELERFGAVVRVVGEFPSVLGNEAILRQVLANLLTNAAKFVPPDRKPVTTVQAVDEGEWCKLLVRDNGIGIERAHQQSIFGLFQRLHRDSEYPGTGVGLAMVEKGVHLLGGTVGVESEPGQGSTFWVRLRKAPRPAPAVKGDLVKSAV